MTIAVSPSETEVETALRGLIVSILPDDVPVVLGQVNRAAEPKAGDFVVYWPKNRPRLSTNQDDYVDSVFTGSIAGTTLTVTAVVGGEVVVGSPLFGVGVADGTVVSSQASGTPGGAGAYVVSVAQTLASRTLATGTELMLQATQAEFQIDVHGPNSADNAQIISTFMRDARGVDAMNAINANVTPLFADDPQQLPFVNDQNQYEYRWVVQAQLQANLTVVVPQQFADSATIQVVDTEVAYPPS